MTTKQDQALKHYTGVGSRETPEDVLLLMQKIGMKYAKQGWILRSGGAVGADAAFSHGCLHQDGEQELYIPWNGFNGLFNTTKGVCLVQDQGVLKRASEIAAAVHPNWNACSKGAKDLHTRNVYQVLGADLQTPSRGLICWSPIQGSSIKGGTRTAWEVARYSGIPCFNLAYPSVLRRFELHISK